MARLVSYIAGNGYVDVTRADLEAVIGILEHLWLSPQATDQLRNSLDIAIRDIERFADTLPREEAAL